MVAPQPTAAGRPRPHGTGGRGAAPALVTAGLIAGAHGLAGWLRVRSEMQPPASLLDYREWRLRAGGEWVPARLEAGRAHGKGLVVRLDRCGDREQAERLAGAEVAIARAALPAAPPDEYYWIDLIGLEVVNRDGVRLGRVRELMETGANDVLVVDGSPGGLIPFVVDEVVQAVDLDRGLIRVDWDADFL